MSNVALIGAMALTAQEKRLSLSASNMANIDSISSSNGQPYKARFPVFVPIMVDASQPQIVGVEVKDIVESNTPARRKYDPGNPFADAQGFVTLTNVDPIEQMVDIASAKNSSDAAIELIRTAHDLQQKTLQLGR